MSKKSVCEFLRKCIDYADASIKGRKKEEMMPQSFLNGTPTEITPNMHLRKSRKVT